MELNLKGKSVIVTGAGSNIGRAIALAFAREGAHVTIAESDAGQGEKAAAEARKAGADYLVVGRPIRNAADPATAARAIQNEIAAACK